MSLLSALIGLMSDFPPLLHLNFETSLTTDSSSYNRTVTNNNGVIDSAITYEGSHAASFNAISGQRLTIAASTDFDFGSREFTVQYASRVAALPTPYYFMTGNRINDGVGQIGFSTYLASNGLFYLDVENSSNSILFAGAVTHTAIELDTYYEVLHIREGNYIHTLINGTYVNTRPFAGIVKFINTGWFFGGTPGGVFSTTNVHNGLLDKCKLFANAVRRFNPAVIPNFVAATTAGAVDPTIVNKPPGTVDGDQMLAILVGDSAVLATTTPPSEDWINIINSGTVDGKRMLVYKKIAASEGANYSWDIASTNISIACITYHNVSNVLVGNVTLSDNMTTYIAEEITPTAPGILVCIAQARATTFTAPLTMTERVDYGAGAGSRGQVTICDELFFGSNVTGSRSGSASSADTGSSVLLHLY